MVTKKSSKSAYGGINDSMIKQSHVESSDHDTSGFIDIFKDNKRYNKELMGSIRSLRGKMIL